MSKATKISLSDIDNIINCYKQCFPNSFSVRLGKAYIKKTFEWYLADESRFLLHVSEDGKVTGFCGGFIPRYKGDGSTSSMLQFAMREAVNGVLRKPWLLLSPQIIQMYPLLFKNVLRKIAGSPKTTQVEPAQSSKSKRAGLVVIGVHPAHRGKGVFELLMNKFEQEALQRGIAELDLSVKKENIRAVKAYERSGWKVLKNDKENYIMQKLLVG